jgi:acetyl-CoA/propionyl-CoA carboxylase biotin carboxyl carrier protein
VLNEPAYTAPDGVFAVHTRWIETEFAGEIAPYTGILGEPEDLPEPEIVTVEVNGKRVEVKLPGGFGARPAASKAVKRPTKRDRGGSKVSAPSGNALTSPMQGTIVKVAVEEGRQVSEGETIAVIEAMKMEQPLNAHRDGVVTGLRVEAGQAVTAGEVLCEIVDAE